jgi:catechol 2,3-dioxygenase-like lactoylglutathione lyase family enzyme
MIAMSALFSPNRWGLTFHHLGLAVKEPQAAEHFLTGLGYRIGPMMLDPLQNVYLGMCTHNQMPDVEIIYPAEGKGPLDKLLSAHKDGLVYHMCYMTKNLASSLDALESDQDLRLFTVSPPKEAVLFGGKRVSFHVIAGFGLIEILDESA